MNLGLDMLSSSPSSLLFVVELSLSSSLLVVGVSSSLSLVGVSVEVSSSLVGASSLLVALTGNGGDVIDVQ